MNRAMRFLTATKRGLVCVALVVAWVMAAVAQVPPVPNPPRLVNDFAGIFSADQVKELEDSLVAFDRRTSNQIAVVTMADLGGMEPAQMAYEIGEQWGVGGKEHRNGVVILVKPKNATRGQAFIATGYGLEGALPDATCKRIVERCMIPYFKQNDYYGGVKEAVSMIKPIAAGEYSDERGDDDDALGAVLALIFVIFIGFIIFVAVVGDKNGGKNSGTMGSGGVLFGPTVFGGGGGRHSGGSSGGGFGGFGGFGGGSFGGGGAGGSW